MPPLRELLSRSRVQRVPLLPRQGDLRRAADIRDPLSVRAAHDGLNPRRVPEDPGHRDGVIGHMVFRAEPAAPAVDPGSRTLTMDEYGLCNMATGRGFFDLNAWGLT